MAKPRDMAKTLADYEKALESKKFTDMIFYSEAFQLAKMDLPEQFFTDDYYSTMVKIGPIINSFIEGLVKARKCGFYIGYMAGQRAAKKELASQDPGQDREQTPQEKKKKASPGSRAKASQ